MASSKRRGGAPRDPDAPLSGNLTQRSWDAIRAAKADALAGRIPATMPDAVLAMAKVAKAHPDEFLDALTEQTQ